MNPRKTSSHPAKSLLALAILFLSPLLLSAQTEPKKIPPPPPPKKTAQAPPQKPAQTPRPPVNQGGTNAPPPVGPQQRRVNPPPVNGPNKTGGKSPDSVNQRRTNPPPPKTTPPPPVDRRDGRKSVTTREGHTLEVDKSGHLNRVVTKSGAEAHFNQNGKVSTIQTRSGNTIIHTQGGGRRVVAEHRDIRGHVDGRTVSLSPHGGFGERHFERGGHQYLRRTYVYNGRTYASVYRGYSYRNVVYYRYVPAYYYPPAYYAWGYTRWGSPVVYTAWGWAGTPWYGAYGYYFVPYRSYPSAAFWLTDYIIAENLRLAYEAQASANTSDDAQVQSQPGAPQSDQSSAAQVTLTPEVKQMIAEEVKSQLAAEQAAAQPGSPAAASAPNAQAPPTSTDEVPPALAPNHHVFVVTTSLDVTVGDKPCSLNPGDVLMRTEENPDQQNTVAVKVVASQRSDCAGGSAPRIQVGDLQEMNNHMQEQLYSALKAFSDNQGKNGLPAGPVGTPRPNSDGVSVPDLAVAADLQKQQQDAAQAEREVQQAASSNNNAVPLNP